MQTKDLLLKLLEENRGVYFSGQEIADRVSISRTAVWKGINALRQDGYPIDGATKRGYSLKENADVISKAGIEKYLEGTKGKVSVQIESHTESTNQALRQLAAQGAGEGYCLIANSQTNGRGRMGRSFYSPPDTGLYLSLLLRPENWTPEQALGITTAAAAAMCQAVKEVLGLSLEIKWVNDLFYQGKKVCGILTEGVFNLETGNLDYGILGVGLNLYPPKEGFPEELQKIAGTLMEAPVGDGKNRLAAAFLNRFFCIYPNHLGAECAAYYRSYSMVIGKTVTVHQGEQCKEAFVQGIDDRCRLMVRYPDGQEAVLSYGEIRISQNAQSK